MRFFPGPGCHQAETLCRNEIESRSNGSRFFSVDFFWRARTELQVVVDPEKLASRQITIADVSACCGARTRTLRRRLSEGKRRWVVRTLGQFRSPEEVENQLLVVRTGAVYVRDVAEVSWGSRNPPGWFGGWGKSRSGSTDPRARSQVLEVMEGLRRPTGRSTGGCSSRGSQLTQVYDETDYIYSSIRWSPNIFLGGALTMIVLMVFLHLESARCWPFPGVAAASPRRTSRWFASRPAAAGRDGFWWPRACWLGRRFRQTSSARS
ncbi:MAG: hypothetical protein Ct9H300mP1_35500 [Planctomycetaceae bacterium]|nr:MAG: hypothetical protein Ct9H300mP1_35500 [Planctomycetaceae bacterium]